MRRIPYAKTIFNVNPHSPTSLSKRVVDCLHSDTANVSELGAIINDCRRILATDFVNSHVKFIRRQANEVAHSLARVAPLLASFHIFSDIPTCIQTIIINEMH
jgi:hypothetical protein